MLTGITLQNFKGIGDPVSIPIKPITLMFGANSSGKSTIIQAIHYAREILERNNVNPDRTQLGGSSIDLGGFRSLVHNHDLSLPMILRFDLDLRTIDLPDYTMWARYMLPSDYVNEEAPDISADVQSADVELTVMWSNIEERPIVKSYKVGLNGEPLVRTTSSFDQKQFTLEVNVRNKLFIKWFGQEEDFELSNEDKSEPANWYELKTTELTDAVPSSWDRPLYIEGSPFMGDENFSLYLAQMMLGPGEILTTLLKSFRYLGPIRSIPSRNHQPTLTLDESRWADGTAAWDALYRQDDDTLIIELSYWMSDERLKTGYFISLDRFRAIPTHSQLGVALSANSLLDDIENIPEAFNHFPIRTELRILHEESSVLVHPSDIGVGISQVVPVLVLTLDTRQGLIAIEQPELHLHPAIQARLGDLFIDSARRGNTQIIETHSEHLLLRLMKRIRQTSAGELANSEFQLDSYEIAVLFVEFIEGRTIVREMPINEQGELVKAWPGGFFEEGLDEMF